MEQLQSHKKSVNYMPNTSPDRYQQYINADNNYQSSKHPSSINNRSLSRTLLRSTGKYAMSTTQSHQTSQLDIRNGQFNASMKSPFGGLKKKEYGVIRLDELEDLRLRATGQDQKTLDQMERTAMKMDLQAKSRSRVANWTNTAENAHLRRKEETLKRLEEEELRRRELDAMEFDI